MPQSETLHRYLVVSTRSADVIEQVRIRLMAAEIQLNLIWPRFILEQLNQMPLRYSEPRSVEDVAMELSEAIQDFGSEIESFYARRAKSLSSHCGCSTGPNRVYVCRAAESAR